MASYRELNENNKLTKLNVNNSIQVQKQQNHFPQRFDEIVQIITIISLLNN